jgi:hypothetical protein
VPPAVVHHNKRLFALVAGAGHFGALFVLVSADISRSPCLSPSYMLGVYVRRSPCLSPSYMLGGMDTDTFYIIVALCVFPALWLLAAYLDRVWPRQPDQPNRHTSIPKD